MKIYTVEAAPDFIVNEGVVRGRWLIRVEPTPGQYRYVNDAGKKRTEVAGKAIDILAGLVGPSEDDFAIAVKYLDSVPEEWFR